MCGLPTTIEAETERMLNEFLDGYDNDEYEDIDLDDYRSSYNDYISSYIY